MSSTSQVDFKLQNFHSAAAYILQKYHMHYIVCNKRDKGPCGHDNQVQGVLVLVSGNTSKGSVEFKPYNVSRNTMMVRMSSINLGRQESPYTNRASFLATTAITIQRSIGRQKRSGCLAAHSCQGTPAVVPT
jgi:hypothetical protein